MERKWGRRPDIKRKKKEVEKQGIMMRGSCSYFCAVLTSVSANINAIYE